MSTSDTTLTASDIYLNGAIEKGRHPGGIQRTFLAPMSVLEAAGHAEYIQRTIRPLNCA